MKGRLKELLSWRFIWLWSIFKDRKFFSDSEGILKKGADKRNEFLSQRNKKRNLEGGEGFVHLTGYREKTWWKKKNWMDTYNFENPWRDLSRSEEERLKALLKRKW